PLIIAGRDSMTTAGGDHAQIPGVEPAGPAWRPGGAGGSPTREGSARSGRRYSTFLYRRRRARATPETDRTGVPEEDRGAREPRLRRGPRGGLAELSARPRRSEPAAARHQRAGPQPATRPRRGRRLPRRGRIALPTCERSGPPVVRGGEHALDPCAVL